MRGILKDTYLEMIDRKTVYVMGIITIIFVLIIIATGIIGTKFNFALEGDINELDELAGNPIMRVISALTTILIFFTVLATSGIYPKMLIRGRADYYISKPISRSSLYCLKFFSIVIIYGMLISACSLLISIFFYFMHDFFSNSIFLLLILNMISLIIWLSISCLAGIVFGSSSMSMMIVFASWLTQITLNQRKDWFDFIDSKLFNYVFDVLYYIFPKTGEVADISLDLALGNRISSMMPFYSTIIFAVVLFSITIYIFKRKNY